MPKLDQNCFIFAQMSMQMNPNFYQTLHNFSKYFTQFLGINMFLLLTGDLHKKQKRSSLCKQEYFPKQKLLSKI